MATTPTARERMIKQRMALIMDAPFFGGMAIKMDFIDDPSCRTAWTNGKAIGFNANFIDSMNDRQLKGLIAHEVMHVALKHHLRRENRNAKIWNVAGDYVINDILKHEGFDLPSGECHDAKYRGMTTQEVYNDLLIQIKNKITSMPISSIDQRDEDDDRDDGDNDDNDTGNSDDADNFDSDNDQPIANQIEEVPYKPDNPKPRNDANSETDEDFEDIDHKRQKNNERSDEIDQDEDQNNKSKIDIYDDLGLPEPNCEVRDLPKENRNEHSEMQADIDAAQAVLISEAGGIKVDGPAMALQRERISILEWQEILRNFISANTKNDYSWKRPNIRYSHTGILMPALDTQETKHIVFAIDTSGSMAKDALEQAIGELSSIISQLPDIMLTVVYCHHRVYDDHTYTAIDFPIKYEDLNIKTGGTDFIPVFEWLQEKDFDVPPDCMIFFTDLESEDVQELQDPGIPVLWLATSLPWMRYDRCDWAKKYEPAFGLITKIEINTRYIKRTI